MKNENEQDYIFPQEGIDIFIQLGKILERVYRRMKSEGYDIIDDKIIHLATGKEYDPSVRKKENWMP